MAWANNEFRTHINEAKLGHMHTTKTTMKSEAQSKCNHTEALNLKAVNSEFKVMTTARNSNSSIQTLTAPRLNTAFDTPKEVIS